jgi:hypothetical protein
MEQVGSMLKSHPRGGDGDVAALERTIRALHACAQACTSCADACLGEDDVATLTRCIRSDLDCADVCAATARLLSRRTDTEWQIVRAQIEACLVACRLCGAECQRHADHMEHCRLCAQACNTCETACADLLEALPA